MIAYLLKSKIYPAGSQCLMEESSERWDCKYFSCFSYVARLSDNQSLIQPHVHNLVIANMISYSPFIATVIKGRLIFRSIMPFYYPSFG